MPYWTSFEKRTKFGLRGRHEYLKFQKSLNLDIKSCIYVCMYVSWLYYGTLFFQCVEDFVLESFNCRPVLSACFLSAYGPTHRVFSKLFSNLFQQFLLQFTVGL